MMMKNIKARSIPTFKTKGNGADERLFSNFISDRIRKKIVRPINKSTIILVVIVSSLPKNILAINNKIDDKRNSCDCVLIILREIFSILYKVPVNQILFSLKIMLQKFK
jgi:hypothetical protein